MKVHVYNKSSNSVYVVLYPEKEKEIVEIGADKYFEVKEYIDVVAPNGGVANYPSASAASYGRVSFGEIPYGEGHRHWTIVVHD